MKTKRYSTLLVTVFVVLAMLSYFIQTSSGIRALAQANSPQQFANDVCYFIADVTTNPNIEETNNDEISYYDLNAKSQSIPLNTGILGVDGIRFKQDTQTLYGTSGSHLGTYNLTTGQFIRLPNPIGSGVGLIGGVSQTITFNRVYSLAFDNSNNTLFAVEYHNPSSAPAMNDLLLQINWTTGQIVKGAFGGQDFVELQPVGNLTNYFDIAISNVTHEMWGVASINGLVDNHLVRINPQTGATSDIGSLGTVGMHGLTFDPIGQLLGVTGRDGSPLANAVYRIDTTTGVAETASAVQLPVQQSVTTPGAIVEYDTIDCLQAVAGVTPTPTFTPTPTETPTPTATLPPTAVTLIDFHIAKVDGNQVTLTWTTGSEINNSAFQLYRSSSPNSANAVPVGGRIQAKNKPGSVYTTVDPVPGQGVWWYWLADINTQGKVNVNTNRPVMAMVSENPVFVPFLLLNR